MSINKYIKLLFISILIFSVYHLAVWLLFTSKIYAPKEGTKVGDLARMSYQTDLMQSRERKRTLDKKFIYLEDLDGKKIDIITIGDSFSSGGGAGPNQFYQDFLATMYNKNVVNVDPISDYTSLEIALGLYNSGYLKKVKPEAIIVESVERLVVKRFSKSMKKNFNLACPDITSKAIHEEAQKRNQDVNIINTANYKVFYYSLAYGYKENAQKKVYKFQLNKNLFSGEKGDNILIFHKDIAHLSQFTKENILKVNEQFNFVAKKLNSLGIKLYFMACADKYDLYYDYIKDNKHPKNHFFDLMEPLKKDYYFVNTKKILHPLLQNDVKDVYWIDDTHWSEVASKAVCENEIFSKTLDSNSQ